MDTERDPYGDCTNCGATLPEYAATCDRCHAIRGDEGSGCPRFSEQARAAGESLGGLLRLYPAEGCRVRFVGWCPAGAFGLSFDGGLVWIQDWGYMSGVTVSGGSLSFEGRAADLETGDPL